jgi:hypothetical protein
MSEFIESIESINNNCPSFRASNVLEGMHGTEKKTVTNKNEGNPITDVSRKRQQMRIDILYDVEYPFSRSDTKNETTQHLVCLCLSCTTS